MDAASELSQLLGAEDEPADSRLPAAEDEVVGAEDGHLDLRLLDREEVRDRLRQRPEAVFERGLELAELVLGLREGEPAPSSVWSASVESRARASGVSSRASG